LRSGPLRRAALALSIAVASSFTVAACGDDASGDGGGGGSGELALVAYSTPQTLYEETIEPAFGKTPEGEGITFSNSFGASGDQSRAVEAGQPADLVHLSIEPDVTRLVDAEVVAPDWQDNEYNGIVQNSVVVFTVRAGNPEGIETWEDVASGDHDVITPNPFTSGGARWNVMAAYGSVIEQGGTEEEALARVSDVLNAAPVQPKSASDALEVFLGGEGDVLISYENEAIRAQGEEDVEYVIPDETILIETPAAITTEGENPEGAQAFLDYLYSDEGQQLFADGGYRPVVESVLKQNEDTFPTPPSLFTIDDLGGWETITTEFFDPESGSIAEIERNLGVTTG
jgi:sulfate transport system substrate-binding protein